MVHVLEFGLEDGVGGLGEGGVFEGGEIALGEVVASEEGEGKSAVGDEGKVRAVGEDSGVELWKGGMEIGASFVGGAGGEVGAGAADEPGGAEAGGGEFFFDDWKNLGNLLGGEGGVDPGVAKDDAFVFLMGRFEDGGGSGGFAVCEEKAGVEEVDLAGVLGVECLDFFADDEGGGFVV